MPDRNTTQRGTLARSVGSALHAAPAMCCILLIILALGSRGIAAQPKQGVAIPRSTPVVMLSDLHFDPFHDPAKIPLLAGAPISEWDSILAMPDSPQQPARFGALAETCKSKGPTDTPYTLLRSSLAAARAQSPEAGFVTVSGDLLVHDLDCKYRATMKLSADTTDDQSISTDFAEKTTAFVIAEVEATFPKIPVYVALGNNDSRCDHNRLDLHDEYLKASSSTVLAGLRGVSQADKDRAQQTYQSAGYYSLTMPAPMVNMRLIVLDDTYMMPSFTNCKATEDRMGEQEQMAWLQNELDSARLKHQHAWVLGHLPPSVNPGASLSARGSYCAEKLTVRFQDTDALANRMTEHASTISLGIFGHTHMDEFHLLVGASGAVPVKVVAAVSPVDGNLPSFTIGVVDPVSAKLIDYAVYEASNTTGVGTDWSKEYDFDTEYHEQGFTAPALTDLIGRLRDDKEAVSAESRAYRTHFRKGSNGKKLSQSWPGYVCSLDKNTADSFRACVCAQP